MIRELRPRRRTRITDTESDESTDEAGADGAAQIPQSSIEDLISPADVSTFDQTFTDESAELDIEGEYEPVAGTKQVIPRIAYVQAYQYVYNPDAERWEPQEGNESGGSGAGGVNSASIIVKAGSAQSFPTSGTITAVTFDATEESGVGAPDLSANAIDITESGLYLITAQLALLGFDDGVDVDGGITVNGSRIAQISDVLSNAPNTQNQTVITKVRPRQLSAGDSIGAELSIEETASLSVNNGASSTYLSAVRLT
jgi:hypothetical protein